MNYEAIGTLCAAGELTGRHCIVNRQGFPNSKDFVVRDEIEERFRIMTVGDSFTHGFTADIGKSYVEYLDATFPTAEIWNLGIGGTGTVHSIQTYNEFAPAFKPQLTTLGFTMNDFHDNLLTYFYGLQLQGSDGNIHFPRYPQRDRWGRRVLLPQELTLSYAVAGYTPPMSDLELQIGLTRLGTLALRVLDRVGNMTYDSSFAGQVQLTRQYLTQLRDAAAALDSGFLVLLIPRLEDIGDPGTEYAHSIMLMEALGIPYLNPITVLATEDYVPAPDRHWNTAGHQKVGGLLADCIERFMNSGGFTDCAYVTLP